MTDIIQKDQLERDRDAQLKEYGIRRVSVDQFHIDGFRYSELDHAIAQAKRTRATKQNDKK